MLKQKINNRDREMRSPTNERKNMNNQFDELTRSMAQSVTRRAALKKFGLGLVGMALAGFLAVPAVSGASSLGPLIELSRPNAVGTCDDGFHLPGTFTLD